jgi:hypothetical protein
MNLPQLFTLVGALTPLAAQSLSFAHTVLSPGFVQAGATTLPVPVGPVAPSQFFVASNGVATAWVIQSEASPGEAIAVEAWADGDPTAAAASDTGVWRIDVSQPIAGYVSLRFVAYVFGAIPGAQVTIDVGANGTIDCDLQNPVTTLGLVIGPTPLPILVRARASSISNVDDQIAGAAITVLPPLGTETQVFASNCPTKPDFGIALSPSNDTLFLTHQPCNCIAQLLVFGFDATPLVLTPFAPTCSLLLPRPDIVLIAAPSSAVVTFTVPIPASVRPFSVWAQAVALDASGGVAAPLLKTSDAYWIVGQP